MIHTITKIDKGKFKIEWLGVPNSDILLDFNPVMIAYRLAYDVGVLEHWQAKPFGLRRWGLYDILSDSYYSADAEDIIFGNNLRTQSLQIPEQDYPGIRPTAVKLYYKASVRQTDTNKYLVAGI